MQNMERELFGKKFFPGLKICCGRLDESADKWVKERKDNTGQDKFRANQHKECTRFISDDISVYHQNAMEYKYVFRLSAVFRPENCS